MKRKTAVGAALAVVIAVGAGLYAFAAPRAGASSAATPPVLTITLSAIGSKQGVISKTNIPVLTVSHEIVSPRDPATGLATGRRQHRPMVVTMQWGAATPKFINALVNNENLTSVLIGLLRNGTKVATIKLTNANVSDYVQTDQGLALSFTYQKITWTWVDGGISAQDDWSAPAT